jgi:hypothetical protein
VFSPGDVIQEVDNTVIGTIVSIGSPDTADVDIVVNRGGATTDLKGDGQALADGVKIYHRNPITLILSFEK